MLNLYYAKIDLINNEQVYAEILEKVNVQRREKVLRCKDEQDRLRSLLAGYLLRYALEHEGIDFKNISILIETGGKPVIKDMESLFFSISHAGEYAVCLIADRNVGVDIETKRRNIFADDKEEKLDAIARKILTKNEWESFLHKKGKEKEDSFLQFWTRKESYSKADGRGIGIGLEKVSTDSDAYLSKWLDENTMLSIFVENEKFSDLQIKEITSLLPTYTKERASRFF